MGIVEDAIAKYEWEELKLQEKRYDQSIKFIEEEVKPDFKDRFGDYEVQFIPLQDKTCLIKLDDEIMLYCYEKKMEYYSTIYYKIHYQCEKCGEAYPSYRIFNLADLGREIKHFREWKKSHQCKLPKRKKDRILEKLYSLMEDILEDLKMSR